MSLTTTASRPLRSSLPRPRSTAPSPCSAAKPTSVWPGRARPPTARPARPSVGSSASARPSRPLLVILSVDRLARPEVGDRRGHQQHVALGEGVARGRLEQLGGGLDLDDPHAGGRGQRHVGGDQGHLRAAPGGLGGQREAHAARRAVADVAHGVDRLARAAGGDEHAQPVQRRRAALPSRPSTAARMRGGLGQPPDAPLAPRGEPAGAGLDDRGAARAQQRRGWPAWPGARTCGCSSPARRTSGAVQASAALVSRLSASPCASLAIVLAEAGATQSTSARRDQLQMGDRVVRRARARPGRRRAPGRARTRRPARARR